MYQNNNCFPPKMTCGSSKPKVLKKYYVCQCYEYSLTCRPCRPYCYPAETTCEDRKGPEYGKEFDRGKEFDHGKEFDQCKEYGDWGMDFDGHQTF